MEGYSVKIISCTKELTAKERIKLKDTTNAISLDEQTQGAKVIIDVDYFAKLAVHNEKSEDKDYSKYVVVDKSGAKFVTGSESFATALSEIHDEMMDAGEEYSIEAYRMPSKNYKGKEFITCSVI